MSKKRLVFATGNQGKVNEFRQMLGDDYEILSMKDIGVDIDKDSIDLASSYCGDVNFICSDICDLENDFDVDTIFQNPPFGSQKNAKKGADLKFISKAIELSPKVLYSFHMASTEEFLISYFEKNDLEITHIFRYNFPIPKIYEFHTRESANVEVIVIRAFL